MDNLLEICDLSKNYNNFHLNNINLTIPKGYIMGLIGPNGAGKTTTIKLILNMLRRASGTVTILGKDNIRDEKEIKQNIGVVFDSNFFSDDWLVCSLDRTIGRFYENWSSKTFHSMLKKFDLDENKRIKELSKGMQMKLMLVCAFSYNARLLILDEPTSGLDPVSRDELLDILTEYIEDGEHSVLFSTHITSDLDKVADYITYIDHGELLYTGGKDEFIDSFRIVKGGPAELNRSLKNSMISLREYSTGFEGLIKTRDLQNYHGLTQEAATIDDIIVYTNKGGMNHE